MYSVPMTKTVTLFLATMVCTLGILTGTAAQGSSSQEPPKGNPVTVGTITFDDPYVDVSHVDDRRSHCGDICLGA
jgi:hypothetical protein